MTHVLAVLEVTWHTLLSAKHKATGHPDTALIPTPQGLCCHSCLTTTRTAR